MRWQHLKGIAAAGFTQDLSCRGILDQCNEIDTLIGVADKGSHWTAHFYERVLVKAKKDVMRQFCREGYKDEEGRVHRSLSIQETDPQTGVVRRGYKQLR